MPNMLRNVLAVIAGFVIGSVVNMALITIGPMLIPPPAGVDLSSPEGLREGIHLFSAKHFVTPFLAHALGAFVGALAAYSFAVTHKARVAYIVGGVFLLGGIAASMMIPAPTWFMVLDLVGAYLPMAWLAVQLASRRSAPSEAM